MAMTRLNPSIQGELFLLAGGARRTKDGADPLLRRMFDRLCISAPEVVYIGTASDEDGAFFEMTRETLLASGAETVSLAPLTGRRKPADRTIEMIEDSDLIFIGGGDVEKGMRALAFSGMIPQLNRLFRDGRAFCGVSAGSIMLSKAWVHWLDPANDATAKLLPCLGFARFICDTHDEESGWEELRAALRLSTGGTMGYGIPSGAAIAIDSKSSPAAWGHAAELFAKVDRDVLPCAPLKAEKAEPPLKKAL